MKKFAKGDTIAREGEPGKELYILLQGRVAIYKGSIKLTEFDQKGVIIGEISVILGKKRTATIRAMDDCLMLPIPGDMDFLIAQHPELVKKMMANLAERLERTTEEYWMMARDVTIHTEKPD